MASPNQLNPNFERISLRNGSAVITGGLKTSHTLISQEVGSIGLSRGSLYVSSAGSGQLWILWRTGAGHDGASNTWTQIK
jgi:hypothetical protein